MKTVLKLVTIMLVPLATGCAGNQLGEAEAGPLSGDQISVTVVNEVDGPVDVFYFWESRTPRARLGTVAVGRSNEFRVPWVTGRLLILFESPVLPSTITSNALELSEGNRPDGLIVRLDWRHQAILEIRK